LGIEVEEGSQMDAGTGTRREEPLAAGNAATQNEEPGNGDANVSLGFHNGLASGTPFVDPGVVASMLLGLGINGTAEMTLVNPSNGLDMPPELSSGPVANAMLLSVGTAANVLPDLGVSGAAEVPPVNSGTTEDPHTAVHGNDRVVHGRSTSHVHRHKRQSSRRHTPYDRVSKHSKKTAKKTLAKQAAEIVALCSSDVATCVPPSSSDCDAALASSASGSERAAKPVVGASSADIPAGVGASVQPPAPAMSSREDNGGSDIVSPCAPIAPVALDTVVQSGAPAAGGLDNAEAEADDMPTSTVDVSGFSGEVAASAQEEPVDESAALAGDAVAAPTSSFSSEQSAASVPAADYERVDEVLSVDTDNSERAGNDLPSSTGAPSSESPTTSRLHTELAFGVGATG
ncbi:hypothetical protein LPJ60_006583, partial [Coemansia sp. RSA 2675]